MASYFRPRRGKKATAISQNIVLKKGEFFCESPVNGIGSGTGKIKLGDGITAYEDLPYFIDPETSPIEFAESSASNYGTLLNEIISGAKLTNIVGSLKKLLKNVVTDIEYLKVNGGGGGTCRVVIY